MGNVKMCCGEALCQAAEPPSARGEVRQAGDICAVSPEGHALCDRFFIECKHLKECSLDAVLGGKGDLVRIWDKLDRQASDHGKHPLLILRRNNKPTLLIASWHADLFNASYRAVFYTDRLPPMFFFFFEEDILKSKVPKILVNWKTGHGRAPDGGSTPAENPRDAYRGQFQKWLRDYVTAHNEIDDVYILGDLTEASDRHSAWLVNQVVDNIHALSRLCSVTIICGNHDRADADQPFFEFAKRLNDVTWINKPKMIRPLGIPAAHGRLQKGLG